MRKKTSANAPTWMMVCGAVGILCLFILFNSFRGPMSDEELARYISSGRSDNDMRRAALASLGIFFSLWFLFALFPAWIAERKGHTFWKYFIVGLLLPIISLVIAFLAPPIHASRETVSRFPCPECGESIPTAAKSCRFCNAIITQKDKPRLRARR